MRRWHNQRGEIKLGLIVSLAILVLAVVAAIRAVPVMLAVYELADFAARQAEQAALPGRTDAAISEGIVEKAQALKLPLSRENIRVSRRTRDITVEYSFEVDIRIPLYTYTWKVHREINRPLIFA